MNIMIFIMVFIIGGFLAVQAPMNGGLTKNFTHHVFTTVSIGFLLGSLLLLIVAIISGSPFPDFQNQDTKWWHWLGGVCGAAYVTITTLAAPKVGVAFNMVLVLLGRVIFSTCVDQFGWVGCDVIESSPARVIGMVIVILGAFLVGLDKQKRKTEGRQNNNESK